MIMEPEIVQLGRASIETREPVGPPIFYDGILFPFFPPWWLYEYTRIQTGRALSRAYALCQLRGRPGRPRVCMA